MLSKEEETHTFDLDNDEKHAGEELKGQEKQCNSLAKAIHTLELAQRFSTFVSQDRTYLPGALEGLKEVFSKNTVRVSFIGESGIDNGALRKEILTEMMSGVEANLF
ncbi:hypothetical protein ATANTOWER_009843 [Ataeniobius toweri]|uniref:Uncharacterized protein n=1 Tax=Ataeniobius toweri TaxID=208326 RepID=A0ABU7AXJ0_9TELE|nr:hypothetical protein [Ataeniobius toweri]